MEKEFNPNDVFTGVAAVNVLPSADEVRLNNLAKIKQTRRIGVTTMKENEKLRPEEVPSDDFIMKEDERKQASIDTSVIKGDVKVTTNITGTINDNILKCISNRIRVTFGTEIGEIAVPAIDILECSFGLMLLVPNGLNDTSFSPAPGAHITVKGKGKEWQVFSSGLIFNLTFLDINAVILIFDNK